MNIFALDSDPVQSAKWLCNRHCIKMMLESCQLLCTPYWLNGIKAPYKKSHQNHPSAIWTRSSFDNYQWLIEHAYGISDEYTSRYGKIHKSLEVLNWCEDNVYKLSFDSFDLQKFSIAISDDSVCRRQVEFVESDPVHCYKLYYIHDKKHLHQWKQNKPEWIS